MLGPILKINRVPGPKYGMIFTGNFHERRGMTKYLEENTRNSTNNNFCEILQNAEEEASPSKGSSNQAGLGRLFGRGGVVSRSTIALDPVLRHGAQVETRGEETRIDEAREIFEQGEESCDSSQGTGMGSRSDPVRDRWKFFRRPQSSVQTGDETLGEFHLR